MVRILITMTCRRRGRTVCSCEIYDDENEYDHLQCVGGSCVE
jgi:hypothetical protein